MRTTFIRALAVAVLATSMSAWAADNDSKPTEANPCATAKQDDSSQATSNAKKDKKSRKDQNKQQKDQENNTGQFTGIWG